MIHVCAPAPVEVVLISARCATCNQMRRMVAAYYEWYGPTWTCLRCGDSWNEDGRCERPFRWNWRPDAVRSAWATYARHRNSLRAPTTHADPSKPLVDPDAPNVL